MSVISGIGGTVSPLPPPVIGPERHGMHCGSDAASAETAQARNATEATPQGSASSDATTGRGDDRTGEQERRGAPQPTADEGPRQAPRATARSVIEAQLSFLIAPPFDGEPSPEAMADAASEKMRFQLLLDAINARKAAQPAPAPAASDPLPRPAA